MLSALPNSGGRSRQGGARAVRALQRDGAEDGVEPRPRLRHRPPGVAIGHAGQQGAEEGPSLVGHRRPGVRQGQALHRGHDVAVHQAVSGDGVGRQDPERQAAEAEGGAGAAGQGVVRGG